MPEIPEMENYKIQLQSLLGGKIITDVKVNREKSINMPVERFSKQLLIQSILHIDRVGKALLFRLSSGQLLYLHLMLGGSLYISTEDDAPKRTKQVVLSFGNKNLYFIGLRLGYLHLLTPEEVEKQIDDMGPDALSTRWSLESFLNALHDKRSAIKTALTDQTFISGIGNRYSDEICFAAACDPRKKANMINESEAKSLLQAIHTVLNEAIQSGGYMDEPLFQGDRLTGGYASRLKVHGREGETCIRCGSPIKMIKLSSKKTYLCPQCQK